MITPWPWNVGWVTQSCWKRDHWVDDTRLTISWVIWRRILSWPWNVGQRLLKIIENGTIWKLRYGFHTLRSVKNKFLKHKHQSVRLIVWRLQRFKRIYRCWAYVIYYQGDHSSDNVKFPDNTVHDPKPKWNAQAQQSEELTQIFSKQ